MVEQLESTKQIEGIAAEFQMWKQEHYIFPLTLEHELKRGEALYKLASLMSEVIKISGTYVDRTSVVGLFIYKFRAYQRGKDFIIGQNILHEAGQIVQEEVESEKRFWDNVTAPDGRLKLLIQSEWGGEIIQRSWYSVSGRVENKGKNGLLHPFNPNPEVLEIMFNADEREEIVREWYQKHTNWLQEQTQSLSESARRLTSSETLRGFFPKKDIPEKTANIPTIIDRKKPDITLSRIVERFTRGTLKIFNKLTVLDIGAGWGLESEVALLSGADSAILVDFGFNRSRIQQIRSITGRNLVIIEQNGYLFDNDLSRQEPNLVLICNFFTAPNLTSEPTFTDRLNLLMKIYNLLPEGARILIVDNTSFPAIASQQIIHTGSLAELDLSYILGIDKTVLSDALQNLGIDAIRTNTELQIVMSYLKEMKISDLPLTRTGFSIQEAVLTILAAKFKLLDARYFENKTDRWSQHESGRYMLYYIVAQK